MDVENPTRLDFNTRFRRSVGRDGRTKAVSVKLTQAELSEVNSKALNGGKATGEWSREVLLREARRSDTDPLFTELIAMRMYLNLVLKHISCGERLTAEMYTAVLSNVRATKHKQALEVLQQYTTAVPKES